MGFSVCPEGVENQSLLRLVCAGGKGKQNDMPSGVSSAVLSALLYAQ